MRSNSYHSVFFHTYSGTCCDDDDDDDDARVVAHLMRAGACLYCAAN